MMKQSKYNLAEEMLKNLNEVQNFSVNSTKLNIILESLNKAASLMENTEFNHQSENLTTLIEHLSKKI